MHQNVFCIFQRVSWQTTASIKVASIVLETQRMERRADGKIAVWKILIGDS